MNKIRILQPYIANQIAAGEVVERPYSVVKELVENSVDAGSTFITVEIKGGGIEYIRVTDNGHGIPPDEAELAFSRHATSKISQASDLEHIETLGFRGEALASIAAVSRVELKSCLQGSDSGIRLVIEGGETKLRTPYGCPEGTTVEVRDVFYNVPARLKFLKAPGSEAGAIFDYVSRMILARPDIAFKVISNDKSVYSSAGDGDLRNAVLAVYGNDVLQHLRQIEYDDGYIKLFGFAGTPEVSRSNRQQQTFFINGRYFKSQKLSYAVQSAYDTRLMTGRFPFLILGIMISNNEIDVNVHPNKMEIRFLKEGRVQKAVTGAIRSALTGFYAPELVRSRSYEDIAVKPTVVRSEEQSVSSGTANDELNALRKRILEQIKGIEKPDGLKVQETPDVPEEVPVFHIAAGNPAETKKDNIQSSFPAEPFSICGKIFDTYWIIQQGDSIYMLDQHAIHERMLYEQLSSGIKADSQILLIPKIIKLSPVEYDTLIFNIDRFAELGFEIEEFGAFTVCIRAVPHIMGEPQTQPFLFDAISGLMNGGRALTKELKRNAIIQAACKHAVKAGDALGNSDIEKLINEFLNQDIPLTCPHGRPVMIRMSRLEIEKLFKRVI